ncbi:hypothetical protein BGW36DRAFT_378087 [Talaromyces proteolyticus]|uniref:Putative lipoate-protein ligase A n=1 Tax=Talaromyces proteolyticus TaxID=1131652 RepID=A0AAD4KUP8_9EURO|nr:uncharacterized protein BGW36DRAFT_378087 [Talaromyces proteolyticus]KAH8697161.1 hypothetical protein BGW36DRAFT_378087 [Talaromyces proteolyticus]
MLPVRRPSCVWYRRIALHSLRPFGQCRPIATLPLSSFAEIITRGSSKHQVYRSSSSDPFVNLSIEQYLLQNTPEDSDILFLYVNRPCVVIGRNQNPWLETNLGALAKESSIQSDDSTSTLYVRRHSGGGAVFHDAGNLNYSVTCPRDVFTRDRHAEMVARALRRIGAINASVNERHDIVLTQQRNEAVRQKSTARIEDPPEESTPQALKISGSAYKLTRNRALHHGTCLVDSPNVQNLGAFLRSPARPYVHAKGVGSVRSPVGNVSSALVNSTPSVSIMHEVITSIVEEFAALYKTGDEVLAQVKNVTLREETLRMGDDWVVGTLGESLAREVSDIQKTVSMLKSNDFKFLQTPEFTFSTFPTEADPRPRPPLPHSLPRTTSVFIRAKKGGILEAQISTSSDETIRVEQETRSQEYLCHKLLHEMDRQSWNEAIRAISSFDDGLLQPTEEVSDALAEFLCDKFGVS